MVGRGGGTVDAAARDMGPYSSDLRRRIVAAYQNGEGSIRDLAERFHVAPNTVQNYLRRVRATGDVAPCAHGGGARRRVDEAAEQEVCALLEEKSHSTLAELAEGLERRAHVHVSVSTMYRTLRRMEITRKKGRWVPASRNARTFNRPARVFKVGRVPQTRAA
jgi:transposase